jgi:hypothetical protein
MYSWFSLPSVAGQRDQRLERADAIAGREMIVEGALQLSPTSRIDAVGRLTYLPGE